MMVTRADVNKILAIQLLAAIINSSLSELQFRMPPPLPPSSLGQLLGIGIQLSAVYGLRYFNGRQNYCDCGKANLHLCLSVELL